MARLFDGIDDILTNTGATPVSATPLTMACWFRCTQTTAANGLVAVGVNGSNDYHSLLINGAAAGDPVQARTNGVAASSSTGYSVNTWHHACGVYASATDRRAFIDGGSKGTNATSATPTTPTKIFVGCRPQAANDLFFSGRICEVALWSAALEDVEVAVLAKGLSPLRVRPDSLVAYYPVWGLHSPEIQLKGGTVPLTVTGATLIDHAPVRPFARRFWNSFPPPPSGTAYTLTADPGAVTITGTAATLRAARRLAADAGAESITGTAASLKYGRLLSAGAGSVLINGTAATLLYSGANKVLAANAGVYSITGTAANLLAGRRLTGDAGAYSITGTDATLIYSGAAAAPWRTPLRWEFHRTIPKWP